MNSKLLKTAIAHSVLVLAYIIIIVSVMNNAEKLFGPKENMWAPVAFLMLFVLSAAVMGTLIFVKPVIMYMEGAKKEAIWLLGYILGCLVVITVLALVVIALL
ncbi:MAG: hypothetical protein A3H72_01670 [Candidatus Doudnabacteria bacterium RIFCSPLOWO2_02_FULL_48_8]|nr:MAG: hypothetical protein A3H72_01670 [Candidatus Doudnabacteria bacterium RIFCSPLOWO2_02_FULL_48_8]